MPLLRRDAFSAVLLNSPALEVTTEQSQYIRNVLDVACSDSRFAEKAYAAIMRILTGGSVVEPVLTALSPDEVVLGSPSFTLRVNGTGFTPDSVIQWNGSEELTTFVSDTQVTTEVDMTTAIVAAEIPVAVLNLEGVISNTLIFSIMETAPLMAAVAAKSTPSPVAKPATTPVTAVKK